MAANDAYAVMGNMSTTQLHFILREMGKPNGWYREHSDNNTHQHAETLKQLSPSDLVEAIKWFRTLPIALEIDGVRIVHASWQSRNIECINESLNSVGQFTPEFFEIAAVEGMNLVRPSRTY